MFPWKNNIARRKDLNSYFSFALLCSHALNAWEHNSTDFSDIGNAAFDYFEIFLLFFRFYGDCFKGGYEKHELVNIIIRITTSQPIPFRDQFLKKFKC